MRRGSRHCSDEDGHERQKDGKRYPPGSNGNAVRIRSDDNSGKKKENRCDAREDAERG
jgi:hypothetical protein